MLSISINGNFGSDGSGDQTPAACTEAMLPNCYTTAALQTTHTYTCVTFNVMISMSDILVGH